MAERTDSTAGDGDPAPGVERAKAILAELAEAACSAALSAVTQQKQRGARQVGGIAEAVRAAARSLDRSDSPLAAGYAEQAADRIEEFSRSLGEYSWQDIVGEVETVARRRPALFVAAAVAAGFLTGRLLSLPAPRTRTQRARHNGMLRPEDAVAAAVSSAAGNGAATGWIGDNAKPRETL